MKTFYLKNTKVSYTQIKIFNTLKENQYYSLKEIASKTKIHPIYVSQNIGILEDLGVIKSHHQGGKFKSPFRELLYDNLEIERDTIVCKNCGEEKPQKSKYSKYKHLCIECTEKEFMSPLMVPCGWCKKEVQKSLASKTKKSSDVFHKECFELFRAKIREEKAAKKREKEVH